MNEFAQLPTPMIATRTLSCCRSRPFPFCSLTWSLHQLLADVQDPLADGDPGRAGEQHDRPGEEGTRCAHEPGRRPPPAVRPRPLLKPPPPPRGGSRCPRRREGRVPPLSRGCTRRG